MKQKQKKKNKNVIREATKKAGRAFVTASVLVSCAGGHKLAEPVSATNTGMSLKNLIEICDRIPTYDDPEDVPFLIKELKNKDSTRRLNAVSTLGKIKDRRTVSALIGTLNDKDEVTRVCAYYFLGKIKGPAAVNALIKSLKNKFWLNRVFAAYALGETKDKSAIPPLHEVSGNDPHPAVKMASRNAMESILKRDKPVKPEAIPEKKDSSPELKQKALEFLLSFIKPTEIYDKDNSQRIRVAKILAKIGGPEIAKDFALGINFICRRLDCSEHDKVITAFKEYVKRHGATVLPQLREAALTESVNFESVWCLYRCDLDYHIEPTLDAIASIGGAKAVSILKEASEKYSDNSHLREVILTHIENILGFKSKSLTDGRTQ